MSVVRRIIKDSIERVKVDELLAEEYEQAGYGGIQLTKTPLGAQINLFAMRPGRVIGKRGRAIKEASEKLETQLGLPNPQITVIEVEVPELNPMIMASRVANALERGVHFRRAVFWSLNRIMESGALGCEIILKGPLRSARSRFEKVVEGYVPKSGDPALRYVKTATLHVKMKRGVLGVTVNIVSPDAKFPDKVDLSQLPEIEYQLPIEPVVTEPEVTEEAPVEEPVLETGEATEEATIEVPKTEEAAPEEATEVIEEPVEAVPVEEETPEPEPMVETETEEVLETPEPVEETPVEEPEAEPAKETPEPEEVPPEPEVVAEPQEAEAEPAPEPLPEAEEQEEAEKKPEPEEETQ
ncbi:MAG: 30S ribosomal protein S3 [Candidatus Bathyarchaeota archaeon]|nr:30S ribosomal protein S3 [Candidatus Bathyarchaeota archaeon]